MKLRQPLSSLLTVAFVLSVLSCPAPVQAGHIATASFEEAAAGNVYTDTFDPLTDHALTNHTGEAAVNYTSTGGELGFSSYYYNTRDGEGLTDGDTVGVTDATSDVTAYPHGVQGFRMSDIDGAMETTLDTVDLTGFTNLSLSVDYFIVETGWEADDHIRIWVVVDAGVEIDLLNTSGHDIDDLSIEGAWRTVSLDLTDYTQATLHLLMDSNANTEIVYFDNIVFTGDTIADAPPRISATAPADGAIAVDPDAPITLAFDESVDLTTDAVTVECPPGTPVALDGLPRSATTTAVITPTAPLPSFTTCTVTAAAVGITDLDGTADHLDGNGDGVAGDDYTFSFTTGANDVCGNPATLIHTIQGDGPSSPEGGSPHVIEGVVVGDFQRTVDSHHLSGFFVQEEVSDWDADEATSEGIFVYEGSTSLLDVSIGDKVRLAGEIEEYHGLTEIKNLAFLTHCESSLPVTPTWVMLPETVDGELEQWEGMLVQITPTMTVVQNHYLGRYGQMTLSSGGRLFQPTNQHLPGSPAATALAAANALHSLILDDGLDANRCGDSPVPVPYLGPPPPAVIRAGDTVTNLIGVLDYGTIDAGAPCWEATTFTRDFRLHPTSTPVFGQSNLRTAAPASLAGRMTVAGFNLLNYFTTLDDAGSICGPDEGLVCRGADTAEEFIRQQDKIVAAMCAIDADVFGLMELENQNPANDPDPGDGIDNYVLKRLVMALNAAGSPCPDKTYTFADDTGAGTDAIRVGLIYKSSTITPVGNQVVLSDSGFTDPNDLGSQQNRPAVAQTIESRGARFTVVVSHLKSKGISCGLGDDDLTTGQGNCNGTRTAAAAYLADWLAGDPTGSDDPDVLIIGDLNAYAQEDPVTTLTAAGYGNLIAAHVGDAAYTYVFAGQSGYLDHALANATLVPHVSDVTLWHINADEPAVVDYDEDFNPPAYYNADPYRAADHDPVIVGLDFDDPQGGIAKMVSPEILRPGETAVYTVTLANTGNGTDTLLVTDTLPSDVAFAEWLEKPFGTRWNAVKAEITWSGTLSASRTLTWTFAVTNTVASGVVTNTAEFTGRVNSGSDAAAFNATTWEIWMPIVLRNHTW